jgi:hypothetical protein
MSVESDKIHKETGLATLKIMQAIEFRQTGSKG